jgi:hypothetical protein
LSAKCKRWQATSYLLNGIIVWDTTKEKDSGTPEPPGYGLQEWLEGVYFDGAQKQNVTPEDITRLEQAIGKLLYFEPCARAPAREVSDDPWFNE